MAVLRDLSTGTTLPLAGRVVVGRAPTAALVLDDKRVSGEHAVLRWNGASWEIRDLGSRNGTFVDGARVMPGDAWPLAAGSRVAFGSEEPNWELVDAGPPGPVARELSTGALVASDGGQLALPDALRPELVVLSDASGRWVVEVGDERRGALDGETIVAGGRTFLLSLPATVDGTATAEAGALLETVTLQFQVSLDEEHVRMTLLHRGSSVPLEPREHGYVLLTLARQRLEDRELPTSEQGWIDRDLLLRMLQLDANGLNVAIYRARGQLAGAGVEGAAGVVEVRRGQRRIGIDPARLSVGPM